MSKTSSQHSVENLSAIVKNILEQGTPLHAVTGVAEEELETLYALGYNFYQHNKLGKAKDIFTYLCLQNSLEPKYWKGLGASCKLLKQYSRAIKCYSVLTLLEDQVTESTLEIIECYIALGNLIAAEDILQGLLRFDPQLLKKQGSQTERVKTILDQLTPKGTSHGK